MNEPRAMSAACGECSDSLLSIAVNIAGILTFAYAVVAGTLPYLQLGGHILHTSRREVCELVDSQKNTASKIEGSPYLLQDLLKTVDGEGSRLLRNDDFAYGQA